MFKKESDGWNCYGIFIKCFCVGFRILYLMPKTKRYLRCSLFALTKLNSNQIRFPVNFRMWMNELRSTHSKKFEMMNEVEYKRVKGGRALNSKQFHSLKPQTVSSAKNEVISMIKQLIQKPTVIWFQIPQVNSV